MMTSFVEVLLNANGSEEARLMHEIIDLIDGESAETLRDIHGLLIQYFGEKASII